MTGECGRTRQSGLSRRRAGQDAAFILGRAAPDAGRPRMGQCPGQARCADRAARADPLGVPGLVERRPVCADGKEQLGIGMAACCAVAPVRQSRCRCAVRTAASHARGLTSVAGSSAPRWLSSASVFWPSSASTAVIAALAKLASWSLGSSKVNRARPPEFPGWRCAGAGKAARPARDGTCAWPRGRSPAGRSASPAREQTAPRTPSSFPVTVDS